MSLKFSNTLTVDDFKKYPVWEFTNRHEHIDLDGELVVEPVQNIPVSTLEGRFIGTPLKLANGTILFGVLIGMDINKTTPLSSLIIYKENESFLFRRSAPKISGPEQLASFLGLPIEDVFPISYDISQYASGDPNRLKGEVPLSVPAITHGMSRKDYFKQILEERRSREREGGRG